MADRRYETLVLIHPDQGEPGSKEIAGRIKTLIEEQGCAVSQVQEWGGRELAYLGEKQRRGFYQLFDDRETWKGGGGTGGAGLFAGGSRRWVFGQWPVMRPGMILPGSGGKLPSVRASL